MGMNIKDLQVHAMAKELARSPSPEAPEAIEARKAAIRAICARTSQELQDALYDEHGLPV